jgi:AraC-like DNA-binding protein
MEPCPATSNKLELHGQPYFIHIVCSPVSNTYHFGIHLSGCSAHGINRQTVLLSPENAGLDAPGQELEFNTQPFRALMLNINGDLVTAALRRRLGTVPPLEDWAPEFALHSGPAACLKSICLWLAYELDRPGSWLLSSSRAAAGVERMLRTLFLDCLEAKRPLGKERANAAATRQVRRVEEWIDAHFSNPISIDDLAEVAGVSVRSLQAAFRQARDCTPMQALHGRRLRAAWESLRAPEADTTVTAVALDCGFCHLGRFARDYRRFFGESPSATLARATCPDRAKG